VDGNSGGARSQRLAPIVIVVTHRATSVGAVVGDKGACTVSEEKAVEKSGYNVVFRTILECETTGAITWTTLKSKDHFDRWYDDKMKSWYEVVAEGVTEKEAVALCQTPEALVASWVSMEKRRQKLLDQFRKRLSRICPDCGMEHDPSRTDCPWGKYPGGESHW